MEKAEAKMEAMVLEIMVASGGGGEGEDQGGGGGGREGGGGVVACRWRWLGLTGVGRAGCLFACARAGDFLS